jgi:hypothetical protein
MGEGPRAVNLAKGSRTHANIERTTNTRADAVDSRASEDGFPRRVDQLRQVDLSKVSLTQNGGRLSIHIP